MLYELDFNEKYDSIYHLPGVNFYDGFVGDPASRPVRTNPAGIFMGRRIYAKVPAGDQDRRATIEWAKRFSAAVLKAAEEQGEYDPDAPFEVCAPHNSSLDVYRSIPDRLEHTAGRATVTLHDGTVDRFPCTYDEAAKIAQYHTLNHQEVLASRSVWTFHDITQDF